MIGPHSVPTPPTMETSAASIEMLKLNAVCRINEIDVLRVERAGERSEERTDHVDFALDARCVDADSLGSVLVLADSDE